MQMGTDWAWCYENPKEAAAAIDEAGTRIASLETALKRAADVIWAMHKSARPDADTPNGEATIALATAILGAGEPWPMACARAANILTSKQT